MQSAVFCNINMCLYSKFEIKVSYNRGLAKTPETRRQDFTKESFCEVLLFQRLIMVNRKN